MINIRKVIVATIVSASVVAYAGSKEMAMEFNNSDTPGDLVKSGWTANDGGKGYKILQVIVSGSKKSAELHIDKSGKVISAYDDIQTETIDTSVDYEMKATLEAWKDMGSGESGPMYHMTFGGLSFDGPMVEAMANMGAFSSFLINIGKNIQD
jgi:hypothetical protein